MPTRTLSSPAPSTPTPSTSSPPSFARGLLYAAAVLTVSGYLLGALYMKSDPVPSPSTATSTAAAPPAAAPTSTL